MKEQEAHSPEANSTEMFDRFAFCWADEAPNKLQAICTLVPPVRHEMLRVSMW